MEVLSAEEARVLGCLLEKEAATPEYYPLTLNALRNACNQTSSRHPVVSYDDPTVEEALRSLREKKLVRIVYSPSNRAAKYRHVVDEELGLDQRDRAMVCLLLLRGPQTAAELRARSERLADFSETGQVEHVLDWLEDRPEPLVRRLPRQPGQKEERYVQLLTGEPSEVPASPAPRAAGPGAPGLGDRVAALEQEVAELRREVAELREALGGP